MKKKLYINRIPRYNTVWGGGNLWISAIYNYCPPDFELVDLPTRADAYFIAGLDSDLGRAPASWITANSRGKPIITRVNDCDARKGTNSVDNSWISAILVSSHTVFVSQWMADYFIDKLHGNTISCSVIINGVERSIWKRVDQFGATPQDYEITKDSLISAHHWSDHKNKGSELYVALADLCEPLNSKARFSYIGRQKCNLESYRNTKLMSPQFGHNLYCALTSSPRNNVYANWSYWDPGSNSILEALSIGFPTYVGPQSGGSIEFVGADHVLPSNVKEAAEFLHHIASTGTATYNTHATPIRDYRECAADYYAVIRGLL